MTCVRLSGVAATAAVLLAAGALSAGCERRGATPGAAVTTTGTSAAAASAVTRTAGTGLLVLGGKTVQLEVRCVSMGDNALVVAKTKTGDKGSVDVESGKVRYADFTVDGVKWMWEPTSTGGARDPSVAKDGKTYTVTGGVHQLDDYKKLADYTFTATCSN